MTVPRQLPLPLPVRTALGREDYFVSTANAMAVALVDDWRNWTGGKFLLLGPEGCGKSHLAHVWAAQSGAHLVAACDLPDDTIPQLAAHPVCVEDVQTIAGDRSAEEKLFHLHNLALAEGQPLMMTARTAPSQWGLHLPDLQSRLQATPTATLPEPDDMLLMALMAKLFADRQTVPDKDVIPYLVDHMPRRYVAARRLVEALDTAALSRKSRITRPMARAALAVLEDR